ncbi:hypothetical protein IAR55_002138 [Kwoniella newhampshirensis]|uniref:Short-chain dehydrogenase/reductase 3 n=1 Tax=Kwoniella newhampshirensis TaxID=1651941 RepID=A0AAW0Z0P5_9TREE
MSSPESEDEAVSDHLGDESKEEKPPRQPHHVRNSLSLDDVIAFVDGYIVSILFYVIVPILAFPRSDEYRPYISYFATCTVLVYLIRLWNYPDRIPASQYFRLHAAPELNWEEQIVLITGGGSGIGALLAETLASRNVPVVVLTKDEPNSEVDGEIHPYICDVSDYQQVESIADRVREEVGDPTIIVNNAGVVKGKLLLDLTEEDVIDTFGANTLAHFWVLKAFLPAMIKKGSGHIVTVSSLLGVVGAAQMTDYCASKAALVNLNQSLRFELDNRYKTPAILTTLVLPSFVQTRLFSEIRLPTSRIWRFLCPPLQPHTIVKHIISALQMGESTTIRLPWYTQAARLMGDGVGLVPAWLRDFLQSIAGADHAMRAYGPKPDAAERLAMERLHDNT